MRQRALFFCGLYMLSGLVCASQFVNSARLGCGLLLGFIIVGILPAFKNKAYYKLVVTGLLFFITGFSWYLWIEKHNVSILPDETNAAFAGEIQSAVMFDGDRCKFILRIHVLNGKALEVPELVQTTIYFRNEASRRQAEKVLSYGATLSGKIEIERPAPPTNPGAFDYPTYLHRKHIHRIGNIWDVESLSYGHAPIGFTGLMMSWQKKLANRAFELYHPTSAGLLSGMLLGAVDRVDPELYTTFSSLGLTHVIAISGQHITLLVVALVYVLRLFGFTRERSYLLTACLLPVYVVMTGSSASAVRALIMGELALFALLMRRAKDGWNLLGASFLCMALANPYYIHDVGFQLSYLVTFGLLSFVPPLMRKLPFKRDGVRGLAAVTLAATLVSFPLTIYYFHVYSFLSPLVNFLFVPFISIMIAPMAAISFMLGMIHPAFGFLPAKVVDTLLLPVLQLLDKAEEWRSFRFVFRSPSLFWIGGYTFWLLFLLGWLYDKIALNWKNVMIFASFSFLLFGTLFISWERKGVTITFLDIGQGDAIVVETPRNVVLIDGGGPLPEGNKKPWQRRRDPFNPVKSVVMPFLYSRGISTIDLLVLTHGDSDHVGGMPYLLNHIRVKQAMVNGLPAKTEIEAEINRLFKEKRISVRKAEQGQVWREEPEIVWRVLNPASAPSSTGEDNANSVVLLLQAYGVRMLFTGDLEKDGEQRLLSEANIGRVDVLKVGHHGSKSSTSENWVNYLKPKLSVISVGKKNRYGHPHREVIARLAALDSIILRTDICGAITVYVRDGIVIYRTFGKSTACR
ncbi:DNA internalization-related competence protein ComEC/Rec2 [Aneurinibacillus thermoaerophilus]|uniref:DNA internalization-related competence protein ComEC/Rec2 n=1 Tax=Aneurinibacillus thermoaerophilus TaxID=143495 RepID=UPI002E21BC01|nr:DNA internalization-related competence protein ComEC/Rec2 [Aneurinibacillus thermoaerophilus]MED0674834.1 DNA internalization-related competence protein ComEC/Rec2 [Aneurinibacillus thermoaerophilus]